MKYFLLSFLSVLLSCSFKAPSKEILQVNATQDNQSPAHNTIQLALLLDVSSSMDGLIDQAKSELWTIVNEVAKAKKNQENTKLEIALYEYGRSTNNARNGYVKKLLDYTSNLDSISLVLFSLNTNGGSEFCGKVIQDAIQELSWHDDDSIYKVIFIAGNEPFNQGEVDYKNSGELAKSKGIFINTIFCGQSAEGIRTHWLDGARVGNGEYFCIDHNAVVYDIPTPFDTEISLYNDSLNSTYWSYGVEGSKAKENQILQDANAGSMSFSVKNKRTVSKASGMYTNSDWDAVDALKNDSTWIEKTKEDDLPKQLQNKSLTEKKSIMNVNAQKRAHYIKTINLLNQKREEFLRNNSSDPKTITLSSALIKAIHKQAGMKGFLFE